MSDIFCMSFTAEAEAEVTHYCADDCPLHSEGGE